MGNQTACQCACPTLQLYTEAQFTFEQKPGSSKSKMSSKSSHINDAPQLLLDKRVPLPKEGGPSNIFQSLQQMDCTQNAPVSQQEDVPTLQLQLTVDGKWSFFLANQPDDPIDIHQVYQMVPLNRESNSNHIRCKRVGRNFRKIQLLFRQTVPLTGKCFFQIDLIEYSPKEKCQLTVGIVNYNQAKYLVHCRDSCNEFSYTYRQRTYDRDPSSQHIPVVLNKKIKVEISTIKQESSVSFYLDDQLIKCEKLTNQLANNLSSLRPYVQTQYSGVCFGWKTAIDSSGWESPMKQSKILLSKTLSVIAESISCYTP